MILEALPVTVERDGWDWLLYALSITATITAIIAFSVWALELRRRPEVRFRWRFSPDGDPANLTLWQPDYVPEVNPRLPFLVEAAIQNTGDRAGNDTLVNFVAPDCFDLRQYFKPETEHASAENDTAGLPPEYRVVFVASRAEPWTPGNWYVWRYRLKYSTAKQCEQPLRVRLLFDVSESRFNSRGRRWLPSILPPAEIYGASAETPWPPALMKRKGRAVTWRIGMARPAPHGRVVCWPGDRRDVRDLTITPHYYD